MIIICKVCRANHGNIQDYQNTTELDFMHNKPRRKEIYIIFVQIINKMDSKVYIFLADGFEELEALAPLDILRRAGFEVETVSITNDIEVVGSHGLRVLCDSTINLISPEIAELLILPGGMPGAENLAASEELAKILTKQNEGGKWLAAICAAPFVLGKLGLLQGKQATCYPGYEQYLEGAECLNQPVVVSQNVITGNGAGAAVRFAFTIVAKLKGQRVADFLAEKMMNERYDL